MKCARSFVLFSFITGMFILSAMFVPVSLSENPIDEVKGTPPGWSDDVPLCDYALTNQYCSIATFNEDVHVVWIRDVVDVLYIKSEDGGKTWGPIVTLYHTNGSVVYPDIGVSGQNVHVVWEDREGVDTIHYRNSTDGGDTWNPVSQISSGSADAISAKTFVNGANLHVIWLDERDGQHREVYYRRSLDGGVTFDNGQGVDEDRRLTFSPSYVSGIRIGGSGSNISFTWCDERDGDWEKYWMISKDNGFSWEDGLGNPNIGRKLSDDTTESATGDVGVNGSNIHVIWEDEEWPGPVYRLYYRNSTDNGLTWDSRILLTGPSVGIVSPGIDVVDDNIHVVWDDEKHDGVHEEIYYKNSTDGGITWSTDLRLTYNLSREARWPRVSVANNKVHILWWDKIQNINHQVMYKRYPDFPDITPPDHFNETPPPESYRDAPGTNVSVHVTDPSGVNESTIQLYVNGSLVVHSLTPITDGYNVSYVSPGFAPGIVECRIVADDNLSNTLDYTWNFTVLALYEIQLHEGWNLISVPHVQVDTAIDDVLRDIDGKWNYIQWYDASDPTDHWKTNATFKPDQLNDLKTLNHKMGFWINITEPNVNLTVRGFLSTYTEIQLYSGWNLIGYPSMSLDTVANTLWGTGSDRVEVFNATAPYRIKEVGPTYVMKPGEGYWVHVSVDSTWVVNW